MNGCLSDGRKYQLYGNTLGKIADVQMNTNMDIDEKIILINKLLNDVKMSFIISKYLKKFHK